MAAPPVVNWQEQILKRVGAPVTPQNLLFVNDWSKAEGGGASNNPFNTTQPAAGASSYNGVGVRNYTSPQQGIQATVQTLENGRYGNILSALKQGTDARATASALAASPWGTGSLVEKMLGAGAAAPQAAPPVPHAVASSLHAQAAPAAPAQASGRSPIFAALQLLGFDTPQQTPAATAPQAPQAAVRPQPIAHPTQQAAAVTGENVKPGDPVADGTSVGGLHPTEGLAGYPARDYFAPAGSPVVAPVTGKVVKVSGHDPSLGPIQGPHGPLGWSVYIQGDDGRTYYLTHLGSRTAAVGQTLKAGAVIGTVANYAKYGTPSHVHMGVHG